MMQWEPAFSGIIRAPTEEVREASVGQVEEGLRVLEETFEKCSKGKAFFGRDSIGYLDIALGTHLAVTRSFDKAFGFNFLDVDKVPNLVGWTDRFSAEAAVKEVMPDVDDVG